MPLAPAPKNGIEVIRSFLGLGKGGMANVFVVAIDFEGGSDIRNAFLSSRYSQLGISVLDTRDVLRHEKQKGVPSIISTHNFSTGSPKRCIKRHIFCAGSLK